MIRTEAATHKAPSETVTCARCPMERTIRIGRTVHPLCRDCRSVLTPEERAEWERIDPLSAEQRADLHMQAILSNPNRLRRALDEKFDTDRIRLGTRLYDEHTEHLRGYLHMSQNLNNTNTNTKDTA